MKYDDAHVCLSCREVFLPADPGGACVACGSVDVRPLHRSLLEGRKLAELPDYLTEEEFAWWLGVSRATVQTWRYEGRVPSYIRVGRMAHGPIRYGHADIAAYMESRRVKVPVLNKEST